MKMLFLSYISVVNFWQVFFFFSYGWLYASRFISLLYTWWNIQFFLIGWGLIHPWLWLIVLVLGDLIYVYTIPLVFPFSFLIIYFFPIFFPKISTELACLWLQSWMHPKEYCWTAPHYHFIPWILCLVYAMSFINPLWICIFVCSVISDWKLCQAIVRHCSSHSHVFFPCLPRSSF